MKTLAFLFALMLPALGRIGETVDECKTRYGEPVETDPKESTMTYKKSGFTIHCQFYKGRVAGMVVAKNNPPGTFAVGYPELSEAELDTLKKANSGEGEWIDATPQFEMVNKYWKNEKSKRGATYNTIKHTLVIYTDEFSKVCQKSKEEKEKANLDGF